MNKFKVGDKVVRTAEKDFGEVRKGGIYEVSGVSNKCFTDNYGINLKGHGVTLGKFDYEASSFELYIEKDSEEVLTPLQAAEAFLNGEDLLYLNYLGNWVDAGKSLHYSLDFLSKEKFKLKPKTILVNGVEVPAPLTKKPNQEFIYFINLSKSRVYQLPTEKLTFNHKYFWATKEGAQQVLNAMLIPFNRT